MIMGTIIFIFLVIFYFVVRPKKRPLINKDYEMNRLKIRIHILESEKQFFIEELEKTKEMLFVLKKLNETIL